MAGGRSTRIAMQRGGFWSDLAVVAITLAALWGLRPFLAAPERLSAGLLLLPGLLLLAGAFAGRVAEHAALPRLTGYIVIGALCGPDLLALVGDAQVANLKAINGLAIGLIALMAGAEIRMSWLRARLTQIAACALVKTLVTPLAIMALLYLVPGIFPFVGELRAAGQSVVLPALLVGLVVLASSPMVVVSVIKESRARGPLSEMAIGVAVAKDLLVILGFTVVLAMTEQLVASGGGDASLIVIGGEAMFRVLLSVAVGLPIGWGLAWLSEREYTRLAWLLVGVSLAVAVLEPVFHIKPLFCLLAAGFACENLWRGRSAWGTHHLERALAQVAAPVFVIFFVAAGLGLDLAALAVAWPAVVALAGTRLAAFWSSLAVATRLSGSEPQVRRLLWTGMIPQAGVTLGLATIIGESFPRWGPGLRDLIVGCVAIHELVGPVLLTWALKRAGERGAAQPG